MLRSSPRKRKRTSRAEVVRQGKLESAEKKSAYDLLADRVGVASGACGGSQPREMQSVTA